jgi:streptogramin lyase
MIVIGKSCRLAVFSLALCPLLAGTAHSNAVDKNVIVGDVVDLNDRPLAKAMVTLEQEPGKPGPTAVTVFADEKGHFQFPSAATASQPTVRLVGYRLVDVTSRRSGESVNFTMIMRPDTNQAASAPASAWLQTIPDPKDRSLLMITCVACHQMPAPEVRRYAKLIHDMPGVDPHEAVAGGWHAIVQYMNNVAASEFGRVGVHQPSGADGGSEGAYSGGTLEPTTALLARTLIGPLQEVAGYGGYRVPVLADAHTVIREYAIPRPNAIREALTLDEPNALWVADSSTNRVIRVDTVSGELQNFEIPTQDLHIPSTEIFAPHTLVRDKQGGLWATGFRPGVIARLDPRTRQFKTWSIKTQGGVTPGIHDLSFGPDRELLTDKHGRLWYSDILHNAVGWFDPSSGQSSEYPIPPVPGRVGNEVVYGLAMSADGAHLWYAQLGIGTFGSFNTEKMTFETSVPLPDATSGPRRIAMSDNGILYVALFGSGQLAAYDTKAGRLVGIYDLPDRASGPYAVTWDGRRKVAWVVTANADAIYRFDPRNNSFAVLPLPRDGAFLRMLSVDKHTGALVTSYANLVEYSHGPRMAVVIELGDTPSLSTSRQK